MIDSRIRHPCAALPVPRQAIVRWLPVVAHRLLRAGGRFRAPGRTLRSEQPEPARPAEAAGHRVAQLSTICSAATSSAATCSAASIYGARVSLIVALPRSSCPAWSACCSACWRAIFAAGSKWSSCAWSTSFLSIPAILLAIITVAVLGPGLVNVIVVLALTRWPRYARVAYGQTLECRQHALCAARRLHGRVARCASCSATSCPTSSAR